jgi:hypothetical protein
MTTRNRPYRFVYDPEEDAAALLAITTTTDLEACGELFVWAYLRVEALAFVARATAAVDAFVNEVGEEGYWGEARRFQQRPVLEVQPKILSLGLNRGRWDDEPRLAVAFELSEAGGITVKCQGLPPEVRPLPSVPRGARSVSDARAVALELVVAAGTLLAGFVEPFPGTHHAGKTAAKIRDLTIAPMLPVPGRPPPSFPKGRRQR